MDGSPEDPIEIGCRLAVDVENNKLAAGDLVRRAIHEVVDSVIDKADPINFNGFRIYVEERPEDIEYGFSPRIYVVARAITKLKHLKEQSE